MLIADAEERHLPEILEIYNHVIATTTAVYSEEPVTLESRVEWWKVRTALHYPVLVALEDSQVLGFASFWRFSALALLPLHNRAFGSCKSGRS